MRLYIEIFLIVVVSFSVAFLLMLSILNRQMSIDAKDISEEYEIGQQWRAFGILFDYSTYLTKPDDSKLSLEEIIARCETKPKNIDEFHQVVFRYEDKSVEHTCRSLFEFLSTNESAEAK